MTLDRTILYDANELGTMAIAATRVSCGRSVLLDMRESIGRARGGECTVRGRNKFDCTHGDSPLGLYRSLIDEKQTKRRRDGRVIFRPWVGRVTNYKQLTRRN